MRKRSTGFLVILAAGLAIAGLAWGAGGWLWEKLLEMHGIHRVNRSGSMPAIAPSGIPIPFTLVNRHIILPVTVNSSRPLSFILDTGDKWPIVNLPLAKELGIALGHPVEVKGVGSQTTAGAFVRDGSYSIPGLAGFSQPVALAIPLVSLPPLIGQEVDGILGTDFIKEFVLELDYQARVITLHNKDTFIYSGPGESVPVRLNAEGHPVIGAEVTPVGGEPIKGTFLVDIGAGGALVLYSPFVAEHGLPGKGVRTVAGLAGAGTGGTASGRTGRVSLLRIGRAALAGPLTLFSEDKAGAYADTAIQGSIGARIARRFRLFFDLSHGRIIFEPTPEMAEPFDGMSPGLRVEPLGATLRIFRIREVLESSPASEAGLMEGDIITAIDGRAASELTLSDVVETLELAVTHQLTVRRGERTIEAAVTPRPLV